MNVNQNLDQAITDDGEINWDCPCLKDALEPPCGDKFKNAFSCYFKSKASPKGSDCSELFESMQKCFEENKEHYIRKFEGISKDSLNVDNKAN